MSLISRWLLVALVSLGVANSAWAQVIAEDDASNYETDPEVFDWSDGSNEGTGFDPWQMPGDDGAEGFNGFFIGDAENLNNDPMANYAPLYTDGVAFAIFGGGDPAAFQDATRPFSEALELWEELSFSIGFSFDNGNKGFDLYSSTEDLDDQVFNFNISDAGYEWTGGGFADMTDFPGIREDGVVIDFVFQRTGSGFTYEISSAQDAGLSQSGSVEADGIGTLKFYINNAGGGDPGNLYFNHLLIEEGDAPDFAFTDGPAAPTATGDYTFTLVRGAESSIDDTINLESSNTNAVTVPATVSFEPEATSVSFTGTVVSLVAGSATITAEDPISFTQDTFEVNIPDPSLTITGPDNIFAGQVRTYTLTRTGFEGDVVTLSSDNEDVLTVPATVNFESEDTVTFQATAVDEGVADITATGDFSASPAFTVTVGPEFISDYSDEAFNYPDGTWVDGSNQGTNFGPWILQAGGGGF